MKPEYVALLDHHVKISGEIAVGYVMGALINSMLADGVEPREIGDVFAEYAEFLKVSSQTPEAIRQQATTDQLMSRAFEDLGLNPEAGEGEVNRG